MVGIVDGAVVGLDIGHQVVDEVLAENIASETCLWLAIVSGGTAVRRGGQQLRRIAVGQYDYHLLGTFVGQQVVKDIIDAAHFIIDLLGVGSTADEVEHRILLLQVLHVTRRQIDNGLIGTAKAFGVIMHVFQTAMWYLSDVVRQGAVLRGYLQQAVLKALVREILRVLRIHDAGAVHNKAIRIHVGSDRSEGDSPLTVGTALHFLASGELHIYQHILSRVVPVGESHRPVIVRTRLCACCRSAAQGGQA